MIRPLTLVSLIAAAGAGLYLYQVKHAVAELDRPAPRHQTARPSRRASAARCCAPNGRC